MKVLACLVAFVALSEARTRGRTAVAGGGGLFASFPTTRRGRATTSLSDIERIKDSVSGSISISKDTDANDEIIRKLVDSVMKDVIGSRDDRQGRDPSEPGRVEEMEQFGERMNQLGELAIDDNLPQLAERDELLVDGAPDVMNLRSGDLLRQSTQQGRSDDDIRCIPKVMQVEETVYDRAIKCHHSYQEKCHMTYITDYRSTTQEKCETTFKKNCHITFKATPFNETVNLCHTPLVRKCGESHIGKSPDICSTHYETSCETRYKTYEVEQDEPVCKMEIMKKCDDVKVPVPGQVQQSLRKKRQAAEEGNGASSSGRPDSTITIGQECEEWPVQKCTLEKKTVKKVHPDTECQKIPKEVCIPNDCTMVQGEEACRDEDRVQIQNIPQEECELQPEESCYAEAVLIPRLVPKPNCIKVPKEICVNTKGNPRRVKKPIVKEWCYRPSDLSELNLPQPAAHTEAPQEPQSATARLFSRISKLLF